MVSKTQPLKDHISFILRILRNYIFFLIFQKPSSAEKIVSYRLAMENLFSVKNGCSEATSISHYCLQMSALQL